MVEFVAFTGLRFGEASALQWDDLDESHGLIHVRRRQVCGEIAPPKTRKRRSVAVEPWVFQVLREHRVNLVREQAPGIEKDIMFPSKTGGYRYSSVLQKPLAKAVEELKIGKRITAHTFRRTFNNLMRQSGIDRVTLRAMTGHFSEEMTEHYSEVTPEEKRRAAATGMAPVVRHS